jgi:AraC-like DNA-binding protein
LVRHAKQVAVRFREGRPVVSSRVIRDLDEYGSLFIRARACRKVLSLAGEHGVDEQPLLAAAGLSRAEVENLDGVVPFVSYLDLQQEAAKLSGLAHFGLVMAQQSRTEMFDVLGYLASTCSTLGEAYTKISCFGRIWSNAVEYPVCVDSREASFGYRHLCTERSASFHDAEYTIGTFLQFGRLWTGIEWDPIEVRFRHPRPADTSEHERFFRAPIRFDAGANVLVLTTSVMSLPLVYRNPSLNLLMEEQAKMLGSKLGGRTPFVAELQSAIEGAIRQGDTSISRVARSCGVSSRTLQRRMAEAQTSFSKELARVRAELACHYLSRKRMTLYEVAIILGYTELSAFYRAFRRWTGTTPSEFRKRGT